MRIFHTMTAILSMGLIGLLYNNCTGKHSGSSETTFLSLSSCSGLDELTIFQNTYHPFLVRNCSGCHISGGAGPGSFGASAPFLAWNSFNSVGPSVIDSRAIDNHSEKSTSQNKEPMKQIASDWVKAINFLQSCNLGSNPELDEVQDQKNRLQISSKSISPEVGKVSNITWNISNDGIASQNFQPQNFSGVTLSASVGLLENAGQFSYVISNPRLRSNNKDIFIKSLLFKLNGNSQSAQRSFFFVESAIRAANDSHFDGSEGNLRLQENNLISSGSLVIVGEVRKTDVLSVSIGELKEISLGPADQFPIVRFQVTSQSITEQNKYLDSQGAIDSSYIANVQLTLSTPSDEISSVELNYGSEMSAKDECCLDNVLNADFDELNGVENHDRDFELVNEIGNRDASGRLAFGFEAERTGKIRVTFRPGETTKSIYLKIVPDHRDEPNEKIHLVIGRKSKLRSDNSKQSHTIQVVDNDSPHTGNTLTYSQLMSPSGLLFRECLRCHNSIDNRGGYDLTNYWQMIGEGILIPGSANSLMFARMNPSDPFYDNENLDLKPMPESGFIPLESVRSLVKEWILDGAKNN